MSMATVLLILHGLVAVALLGAISHQALAAWSQVQVRPGAFFGRFRTVPGASFTNAVVVLYVVCAILGAIVYLYFRVDIRPQLEQAGYWASVGIFDIKEHFVAIGLGLLPVYWLGWRRVRADEPLRVRATVTTIIACIVWWSFLVGHVLNDIKGFGL